MKCIRDFFWPNLLHNMFAPWVGSLLRNVMDHIVDCLRRVEEARKRAERATDPKIKLDFRDIEARWLNLAGSYRFVERLENFLATHHPKSPNKIVVERNHGSRG